ncbi:GntR family transcriptional regulator [Flavihumibacter sp. UBA7668]|uniref:GntR family transcriptional regulator n=1 Tax=Flavihumibacter sp. UBA7668 TaxID=1946542 RepID=UPI0025B7EBB1|nr:GntR family transcriptional regulator [Flavihumibacter sp. UBA7668]
MQFNNTGQAIYLQIVDYVCERVLLGEFRPEDKLPSVREMAVQLEVNPNTVMRAYEFLKQQQIIHDKRGIGYFISEEAKSAALAYRKQEFTESELPAFFRVLFMLGMEPQDLLPAFESFKNKYVRA